ncbi:MAG: T9SS type A sorting domain-containing protein [Candidatus Marinimicrobia bacterium]|jgi:hypothetical protein|nr:T9SS type A sorting domain-containing protein [Candidatus Neomarinimicrobiota bacterium]MBT3634090.1 T9SS type A sorting domain-containing protein [Candidatus Neomarinimicrobiota bacterium]MBT3683036.1 T9SS type A sorting domain-containing protein [Candidatus Neomarinimicrobiota bacterium]MBT3759872.1 T9SS type A sorting domain-containing protein [Candidatus Neomarinimicrobiota bacterium]MBT3895675.1 T9SS type A sorting domain-containing protein [Candidatus Neomarinimicrobiota bacterium]
MDNSKVRIMKKMLLFISMTMMLTANGLETLPLNQKWLNSERMVEQYSRGKYLIVLAHSQLDPYLTDATPGGDFLEFKQSQGFDVEVVSMNTLGLSTTDASELRDWLHTYSDNNPMLEYVLLVGDVTGSLTIPTHFIQSINEPEQDVTDYPYSFFVDDPSSEDYDVMTPKFILGRFSIRNPGDLMMLKSRTIQYTRMENLSDDDLDYFNNGLLVAGNYSNADGEEIPPSQWPVTPVWTSRWLYELWDNYGYSHIDTVYFHADNQIEDNPLIGTSWSDGVGVINYRGWGNSQGWHKPAFHIEQIEQELNNGWKLPVVASFVCNTGDFGADLINGPVKCFAEELTTRGTLGSPKGGVAVIGPSDLDTDTRYNNVICGRYWQALLENETAEIGVALHLGKGSLITEFPQLSGHGDVVEFYHHVYMVIGDPSIPAYLLRPTNLSADIEDDTDFHHSFISTMITNEDGEPVEDVVGALLLDGELIGKGLSSVDGNLDIDFSGISDGSTLSLFLNKAQFFQKEIILNYIEDDGTLLDPQMWAYFDVLPVLSSGNNYVQSGENIQLSLDIMNPSSNNYSDVTITVSEITDDSITGEFASDTITLYEFSSVLSSVVVSGTLGSFSKGSNVLLQVDFTMDDQLIAQNSISLLFGPIEDSDPNPADAYGYWAYDNSDIGYVEAPSYDWIELNPADGGSGTLLPLDDDSHHHMELPFDFQYYGETFNTVTVGSNGWLSLIPCPISYFWNFSIPMYMGPAAMIAPFMDDLDDDVGQEPFEIYAWSDISNGRFIVQWDNVANGEDDELCQTVGCVKETFQVILYDPTMHPTQTGDGEILFQYQEINDIDENGNYSTIGIESPDQTIGIQYIFNNITAGGSYWPVEVVSNDNYSYYHLNQNLAIKFTTDAPDNVLLGIEPSVLPDQFYLSTYPNPFNPVTSILYQVENAGNIEVTIYDVLGRELTKLVNSYHYPGAYQVSWDAANNASGIYLVKLSTESGLSHTQRITLLK